MSEPSPGRDAPTAAPPLAGMAIFTMFRGDPSQLLQWCNFHLTSGADQLYVVLDRPPAGLIDSLPEHPNIQWRVLDETTWDRYYPRSTQNVERKQVDAFRWIARIAAGEGHRYLAFVDADELIVLSENFPEIAARYPQATALRLPVREMWYGPGDDLDDPFGACLAVAQPDGKRVDWGRALGWREQFFRDGFMGHSAGKSIFRLPVAPGALTVHGPLSGPVHAAAVSVTSASGRLLHYDAGSVLTWNAKWYSRSIGVTQLAGRLSPERLALQRLFAYALRRPAEGQRAFFREFFSLDRSAQEILRADGLLTRVDVGQACAGPLRVPGPEQRDAGLNRSPTPEKRVDYQFALVTDRRFVKPTFATMLTVLAQLGGKGSIRFVVLGDNLEDADAAWLRSLEFTDYDVEVHVHDVTNDLDRDVGVKDPKRATFGRIYLIDYLPEQRTVYLDADVLPTRDFSELFELDLGGACIAGVPDSAALRLLAEPASVPIEQRTRLLGLTEGEPLEYLNGGVLILDLDNPDFRGLALQSRALVVAYGRALTQRDQDAMNIAFAGRKYRLDSTFNYMTQFYTSDRCLVGDLARRKYESIDATLVHFSGKVKPWESAEDEFYNGLYRRLVTAAEDKIGISCGFYFSRQRPAARMRWGADQWAQTLRAPAARTDRSAPVQRSDHWARRLEFEVLDLIDTGAYVSLTADMYDFATSHDLRLVAVSRGSTLFQVPLRRLTSPLMHLSQRVSPGVRRLPIDLRQALSGVNGIARDVELRLSTPADRPDDDFERIVGTVDVLTAGGGARPAALPTAGVDGALEGVHEGSLRGWFRSRYPESGDAVSLYCNDELVARRVPSLRRTDLPKDDRTSGFAFNLARLLDLDGDIDGSISVRVAGTNIPLRGSPLPVARVGERDLRYNTRRDAWEEISTEPEMSKVETLRSAAVRRIRRRQA